MRADACVVEQTLIACRCVQRSSIDIIVTPAFKVCICSIGINRRLIHSRILHYDHYGMHSINPISQPALTSQLAVSRDTFPYGRDNLSGLPDLKHSNYPSGRCGLRPSITLSHLTRLVVDLPYHPDTPSSLNANVFGGQSRLAVAMTHHFSAYDRFQYHNPHPITPKHDEYLSLSGSVSLLNSSPSFMNRPENNPLLSQDRSIPKGSLQSSSNKSHNQASSFPRFKPINYNQEPVDFTNSVEGEDMLVDDIKVESRLCAIAHSSVNNDHDDPTLDADGSWAAESMLDGLSTDLGHDDTAT